MCIRDSLRAGLPIDQDHTHQDVWRNYGPVSYTHLDVYKRQDKMVVKNQTYRYLTCNRYLVIGSLLHLPALLSVPIKVCTLLRHLQEAEPDVDPDTYQLEIIV